MNESKVYEAPSVTDYGSLQELTAACAKGSGGDSFAPTGSFGGVNFGTSSPIYGCTSK